jgi:hypothetical protein
MSSGCKTWFRGLLAEVQKHLTKNWTKLQKNYVSRVWKKFMYCAKQFLSFYLTNDCAPFTAKSFHLDRG